MKKIVFISFAIGIFLLQSCSDCNKGTETSSMKNANALIPNDVVITYEHNLVEANQTIFNPLDRKMFVNSLIDKTLSGNINVISAFDEESTLPIDEINRQIGQLQDTIIQVNPNTGKEEMIAQTLVYDRDNLQRMVFEEEWFFDKDKFSMTKKVMKSAPISIFYKNSDTLRTNLIKKLLFWYDYSENEMKDTSALELIGSNISYEFPLYNGVAPKWLESLSVKRFINLLLKRAIDDNKDVYDFFDRSPLSTEQVKVNLGESKEELYVEDENGEISDTVVTVYNYDVEEIMAVIFVEDWYQDTTNLRVYKVVKEIAPVRVFNDYADNGEEGISKKIPFILKLNK